MGSKCYRPTPEPIKKDIFFQVEKGEEPQQIKLNKIKYKLKLEFTIDNCQINHRYQIVSTFVETQSTPFKSEIVLAKNNSITFNQCLICDYYFEKKQTLNINIMKDSIIEGNQNIILGNILGSPQSTYKSPIGNNNTFISVSAQKYDINSYLEVDFKVDTNNVDLRDKKNLISYRIISNDRKIYYSESISLEGQFDKIRIPSVLLQNGLTVNFLNAWQEIIATRDEANIESFINSYNQLYLNLVDNGKLLFYIYNKSQIIKNYDFIDYLRNGVTIKLTIGIDYTRSNKPPDDPLSLHFLGAQNDYEKTIYACGPL